MKRFEHVIYQNNQIIEADENKRDEGYQKTLTYQILKDHNQSPDMKDLRLRFDSLTSHDITYVSIIQTARASGLKRFEQPYVLTNCHNSLCATGGTINEDDHRFALSAAHKYGGIYVPAQFAVIHSYNREMMSGCGRMILGSDSHTRYGALGTMGIGEGGGELVKQLLGRTYDIAYPRVVLVHMHGKLKKGVGPHDVALAIVAQTYADGFVKNSVLEFAGEGIRGLSQDFRNGIDVMTTETTCLSSIWETDEKTREYYVSHKREADYKELKIKDGAYYDACLDVDLSEIECMIALPMHPSYALPIKEFKKDPYTCLAKAQERCNGQIDLLSKIDKDGNVHVDQGVIAGCSGGIYENIVTASRILKGHACGKGSFRLSVYPDSQPVSLQLLKSGVVSDLIESGVVYREAFCGPCFGAGEVPANGELSIRHTTRNFPNREGSKPGEGQFAAVALMDARSIAATAINHGVLTAASELDYDDEVEPCVFNEKIYETKVYDGYGKADENYELVYGPNIKDWPAMRSLGEELLIKVVCHIDDPVTTTDELIPSGETSSYRSNPMKLAQFTLSRRDPDYVAKAMAVDKDAQAFYEDQASEQISSVIERLNKEGLRVDADKLEIASAIYARKPGDGSAREQAASCQRVLGALANFADEYATKRYRSNCINWGILPFLTDQGDRFKDGAWVYIADVYEHLDKDEEFKAYVLDGDDINTVPLRLGPLSNEEKQILKAGNLINYYRLEVEKK